jgi:hypothetical protein
MHGSSDYVDATTYLEILEFMVATLDKYYPDQEPHVTFTSSSSLDFPEDYTDNADIIALCDKLQNGDLL